MVFGGFPKKIRNKTFYFHTKKKYYFFLFLLSFGPRVHFRGQKLIFWQKKIRPKREDLLLKKNKNTTPFYLLKSCPGCPGGTTKKIELSLIGKAKLTKVTPKAHYVEVPF
jgi:hypothetical protein